VPIKGHVGDLEGVYTLNELGSLIWQLINGQATARELAEAVRNEYDVGAAEAEKDVVDFLRSLEEAGLSLARDHRGNPSLPPIMCPLLQQPPHTR
jgi:hypothetical protein